MSLQLCFWILMLLWAVYAVFFGYPRTAAEGRLGYVAGSLFGFLLFLILGWKVFGAPING